MKQIFINFKRFDVPVEYGGVNKLCDAVGWGDFVARRVSEILAGFTGECVRCTAFFPEAHLLSALRAASDRKLLAVGCQGVSELDVEAGGNFGALTAMRPAAAMKAIGCEAVLIGHSEEREGLRRIFAEAAAEDAQAVNRILNRRLRCALGRGLKVLYCVGERNEELQNWRQVLKGQLSPALALRQDFPGMDLSIGYEPVWAIGPGKTPPDKLYIEKVSQYIHSLCGDIPVVYGGGLKADNAAMLASISSIEGGLIALTRFSGDIGFYPEEFEEILQRYLKSEVCDECAV